MHIGPILSWRSICNDRFGPPGVFRLAPQTLVADEATYLALMRKISTAAATNSAFPAAF